MNFFFLPHGDRVVSLAGLDVLRPRADPIQLGEEVPLDDLFDALHVLLLVQHLLYIYLLFYIIFIFIYYIY